jgi:hypothetical protein
LVEAGRRTEPWKLIVKFRIEIETMKKNSSKEGQNHYVKC